jgi:hypothetical protein
MGGGRVSGRAYTAQHSAAGCCISIGSMGTVRCRSKKPGLCTNHTLTCLVGCCYPSNVLLRTQQHNRGGRPCICTAASIVSGRVAAVAVSCVTFTVCDAEVLPMQPVCCSAGYVGSLCTLASAHAAGGGALISLDPCVLAKSAVAMQR